MNIGSSLDMSRPLLAQTSHTPSIIWTNLFKVPRLLLHLDYQSLIALSQVNRQLHQAIDPQIASKEDKFGFVMKAERDFSQHFPKDESGWPGNFACYYCFRVRNPKYSDFRSILVRTWKRVCIECFKIASNQLAMSLSSYPFGMCLFPVFLPYFPYFCLFPVPSIPRPPRLSLPGPSSSQMLLCSYSRSTVSLIGHFAHHEF